MNLAEKIVIRIPLDDLWTDETQIKAQRGSYLNREELKNILKAGPVQFVVANVGHRLLWIEDSNYYKFWKSEAEPHIVENPERFHLEEFPNEYAYLASQWESDDQTQIILLEKYH